MKVSVVVPIYNVEKYVEKCISSIQKQTYENLEILVVNDGTLDRSIEIAKKISGNDDRFIYLEKENGGLSDARNFGIQHATGEFITFIDSDDYVDKDYILKMIKEFECSGSELVLCGIQLILDNNKLFNECENVIEKLTTLKALHRQNVGRYSISFTTSWGILAPREWYTKEFFPKDKIHEDEFTTYKLYLKTNNISFVDYPLYFYRIRSDSIMNSKVSLKNIVVLDALAEKHKILKMKQYPVKEVLISYFRKICMFESLLEKEDLIKIKTQLKQRKKECCILLKKENLSFREKLKLIIFSCLGKIYFKL